jgi:hypothetical protein
MNERQILYMLSKQEEQQPNFLTKMHWAFQTVSVTGLKL